MSLKLSIISLGWMGRYVFNHFGDKLTCSGSYNTQSKNLESEFKFDINSFEELPMQVQEADIIFFNLPPSKVECLIFLGQFFKRIKDKRVILISSTSVYEGSGIFDETAPLPAISNRAKKQLSIENSLRENTENYLILRCAGLYGDDRHPGLYLSGKINISKRKTKINLIGINDILDVLDKVIEQSEMKVLNLVNMNHPTKEKYYNDFCSQKEIAGVGFDDDLDESSKVIHTKYEKFRIKTQLP